jgi:Mg2+-importing ATPase
MTTSLIICCVGIALPYTPIGAALGFIPLPTLYWPLVGAILVA